MPLSTAAAMYAASKDIVVEILPSGCATFRLPLKLSHPLVHPILGCADNVIEQLMLRVEVARSSWYVEGRDRVVWRCGVSALARRIG